MIRYYLNGDEKNRVESLRREGYLKRFLRQYYYSGNVIGPPTGSSTSGVEEQVLLPERWVQNFVNDPHVNSIGERIL